MVVFFFFQAEDGIRDVAVTGVQTCALPISGVLMLARGLEATLVETGSPDNAIVLRRSATSELSSQVDRATADRSEEHTSELQSRLHLVCRLLLEKKKKKTKRNCICLHHTLRHPK